MRIREQMAHVTEEEIQQFEDSLPLILPEAEEVALEATEGAITAAALSGTPYKVVDLRGKFTSHNGNWGTSVKNLGCIGHYNGPPVAPSAWDNPIAWIKFINDLHAQPGRFSPGWTFDGIAYHEFISGDTVYWLRNYGAKLPHCGNLTYNTGALGIHIPVGGNQTPSDLTYRTFFRRISDHNAVMRLGRNALRGHREVGASACPGDIIQGAIGRYRAGQNPGGVFPEPPEPPKPEPPTKTYRMKWPAGESRDYTHEPTVNAAAETLQSYGVDAEVLEVGDPPPAPPKPEPPAKPVDGKAAIIDRYFASTYHGFGPYEPIGNIIVEEADRAGLALEAACALVEQESGGRNIFGCDGGNVGDRPPYCRQKCTKERMRALIRHIKAGGISNGTSVCQLTYPPFIYEAETLGGAHVPRNSMRVGFKLLYSYFSKYGALDGYGSYNAGEGNRASVRNTYSAACINKRNAWAQRLGKTGQNQEVNVQEPGNRTPVEPETPAKPGPIKKRLEEYPVALGTALAGIVNILLIRTGQESLSVEEMVYVAVVIQVVGAVLPTLWTRSVASLRRKP